MKRILPFTKKQQMITGKMRHAFTACLLSLILTLFSTSTLKAQTSLVLPNLSVTGTFLGPFANATRTYQMIIDDTQLTTLSGKYLTSISFRLPASAASAWPASDATFSSYEIYLSDGVDPVNRQLDLVANVVGPQTQVRSGSLLIPAGSFTVGGNPNAFTFDVTFDTPWLYNGTNLVIEIRHTGSNSTSASSHAATTSASGYGTLFTACWKSTGNVMNGNFVFVKINSVDALGIKSVEFDDDLSVYPNPAKEFLYVKSLKDISEFNIFNMVGQKVLSERNTADSSKLNVSELPKGTYVLQMIDKNGNARSTRFVKE
ncbi:T9SS type A sorting domain-containing protein [uncultured Chryseobacterium sp.]|jgi:hypothetical protein|uniref:T9SS type A sorting domain-containing protein n=1 Tax=uncultured Chryseobacterium sp. TaxID=259322 RepID=UPI00261E8E5E|nr:T9SS type A sorting domain-containing protein [uncultured Chryseobacterium sp.]